MTREYLTNKDCAKILYNLYDDFFNRSKVIVSTDVTSIQACKNVTREEIWAYSSGIIFLSCDTLKSDMIEKMRNWSVLKRQFLLMIFNPVFKAVYGKECKYTEELDEFILKNNLCKGIFENEEGMRKWLTFEAESIRVEDAKKIVQNVIKFWIERND